jgi:hypothetical protein
VLDGSTPRPPPADDPGVIAAWTVATEGSAAYEFYVAALPAAGFPVVGRYPGDNAAMIRFRVGPTRTWQLVAEHLDGGTLITVRTDRG